MNLNQFDDVKEFLQSCIEQDCLIHIHPILDTLDFKPNPLLRQSFDVERQDYRVLRQKINYRAFIKKSDVADEQSKIIGRAKAIVADKLEKTHFNRDFSDKFYSFSKRDTEGYDFSAPFDALIREIALEPIFIPQSDKLVSNETRHYFKSLMIGCQDLFAARDFKSIYSTCAYLKKESEPESAQLYQYLLFSYYETNGGAIEIVKEALLGDVEKLKHIWHFANRSLRLNEQQDKSPTHGQLVEILYTDLMHEMNLQYQTNVAFDYILPNPEPESYRQQIWQYIDLGIEMLQYIPSVTQPIKDYCKNVLNEITGGGKLNWLDIGYQWYDRNAFFYTALEKRQQVIDILETHSLWSNDFQSEVNNDLYRNLIHKYKRIGVSDGDTLIKRQQVYRFIKAAKNAYCLLKDNRFLFLCADELRGRGKFAWFQLNNKDEIDNAQVCSELHAYQPKLDLRRIVQQIGSESDAIDLIESEILNLLIIAQHYDEIQQMIADADARYAACCAKDDRLINPSVRQELIDVLGKWRIGYAEFKDESLLEKCIQELKGESDLAWFELDFDSKTLVNHHECEAQNFDSTHFLIDLLSKKTQNEQDTTYTDIREAIAVNCAYDVKNQYTQYEAEMIRTLHDSPENRALITECFEKWDFYYNICFKPELIEWSFKELVGEKIFSWFSFDTEGVLKSKSDGNDAWLNTLMVSYNNQNDAKLHYNVLLNRSKKSAFVELEKEIDLGLSIEAAERRTNVIEAIIRCYKGWCQNEQHEEFVRIARKTICADTYVIWAIKARLDKSDVAEPLPSIINLLTSVDDEFLNYILATVDIPKPKDYEKYVKIDIPNNDFRNYGIMILVSVFFILICVWFANYKYDTALYLIFVGAVILVVFSYFFYRIHQNRQV
jgi:hypothetical protein